MKLKLVETNSVDLGQNQPNDSAFSRRGLMGGLVALALAIGGAAVIQHLNLSNWLGQIVCLALGSIVIECAVNNPLERVQERLWWTVLSVRALVVGCSGCVIVGATFVVGELVLDPRAMVFFEGLTRFDGNALGLILVGGVIAVGISPKLHVELLGALAGDELATVDRLFSLGLWSVLGGVVLVAPEIGTLGLVGIAYRACVLMAWRCLLVKFRPLDRLKIE